MSQLNPIDAMNALLDFLLAEKCSLIVGTIGDEEILFKTFNQRQQVMQRFGTAILLVLESMSLPFKRGSSQRKTEKSAMRNRCGALVRQLRS